MGLLEFSEKHSLDKRDGRQGALSAHPWAENTVVGTRRQT